MIHESVKEAISLRGMTVNSVAVQSKVPQSSLHRFCKGKQGLQTDGLERVLRVLRIKLALSLEGDVE